MAKKFIQVVYGTLQGSGIDTNGLSVDEAIEKFNELKKKGLDSDFKNKLDNAKNIKDIKQVEQWREKEKEKLSKAANNFKGDAKVKNKFLDVIAGIEIEDETSEKILNNLHKLDNMILEESNTTLYNPNKKMFQIRDDESCGLIVHELSHSIEHKIFEKTGKWLSNDLKQIRQQMAAKLQNKVPNELFQKCDEISLGIEKQIYNDYFKNGKLQKMVAEKLNNKSGGMFNNMPFSMKEKLFEKECNKALDKIYISYAKRNEDYMKWSCVCDIYDAMFEGNTQNKDKLLDSHDKSYYNISNAYQALTSNSPSASTSEIVANFMEMKLGGYQEQLKFLKSNCGGLYNQLESTYKKVGNKIEEI